MYLTDGLIEGTIGCMPLCGLGWSCAHKSHPQDTRARLLGLYSKGSADTQLATCTLGPVA